jgi:hypothetical protein
MMATKFLVNLNELSRKETMDSEGRIKALITDPTMTINSKGTNQYEINSFHRFIITTNNEDPVKTSKDDRRNLIIRSSDEKCGNTEYFQQLHDLISNDNVIRTIADDLRTRSIVENFTDIKGGIPPTNYQSDLKESSRSPTELWLEAFIISYKNENAVSQFSSEIFSSYSQWCQDNGFNCDGMNSQKLGVRINNLLPSKDRTNYIETERSNGKKKIFKIPALKRLFELK